MSIFIRKSPAGANLYPPRIACYVCGAEVPSDYPLFPEPSPPSPPPPSLASITAIMSKPHFPFLMHHPPPLGCRPPSPGGVAKSCRVCYSALMRQWDDFERTGVPTERRVYWLKRIDGLSFASPEVQVQAASEVRARILGQFQHHPRSPHQHLMRTSSPRSMAAPTINVSHPNVSILQQHSNLHLADTGSLSSTDRLKASSPLTVVTGNSSVSPMATPTSHGHHGSSIASSWLSRSAIVSGETRPPSGPSPLLVGHTGVSSSAPSSVIVETVHQQLPHPAQPAQTPPNQPHNIERHNPSPQVIPHPVHGITDNDSGALDLSSGARDRETKSRSSVVSHISTGATSHQGSCQSDGTASTSATRATTSTAADILDLTLPDKNALFEVCYICGDEFKRGTLSYTFAKQVSSPKEPFYPSLMCHPRPPRSRPMDSAGRVQTCDECHEHLLAQWNQFEEEGANDSSELVPHADRNYSLRKRQQPLADTTTFVCYICALDYHSSSLRLLYARPNSEQEPYYPFIDQQRPPPGASPISPQGMVQVCTLCYKSTKEKHHGFMKEAQPPLKKRRGNPGSHHAFSLPRDPTDSNSPFGTDPMSAHFGDSDDKHQHMLPADVTCPLCRRKFSVGSFKYLHSQPPPAGGLPYFPFLSELPRPDDYIDADEDKQSRVRACKACTTSLFNQWTTFQHEKLPVEDRNYLYQTLTGPRSSQSVTRPLTPSSIRSHRSGGGKSDRGSKKHNEAASGSNSDELKCSSGVRPRSYSNPFGDHNTGSNANQTRTRSTTMESIPRSDSNPLSPAQGRATSAAGQQPPVCHSPSFSVHSAASVEHLPGPTSATATATTGSTASAAIAINKVNNTTGGGNPSATSSPPSSSSFYCFLCGLHSELTFARTLYSIAPGKKAPYFPFMKNHVPKHKAETLKEDGTALVCTFCYHSVMSQWKMYQDSSRGTLGGGNSHSAVLDPSSRVYNFTDYICYVCSITTYRKRIRALRVMVRHFSSNDII